MEEVKKVSATIPMVKILPLVPLYLEPVLEVLSRCQELVQRGWTRDHIALDRDYGAVDPKDPRACYFCLTGALTRALHEKQVYRLGDLCWLLREAVQRIDPSNRVDSWLVPWNDQPEREKKDVLLALEVALRIAPTFFEKSPVVEAPAKTAPPPKEADTGPTVPEPLRPPGERKWEKKWIPPSTTLPWE
jgi:hypothetical protein